MKRSREYQRIRVDEAQLLNHPGWLSDDVKSLSELARLFERHVGKILAFLPADPELGYRLRYAKGLLSIISSERRRLAEA